MQPQLARRLTPLFGLPVSCPLHHQLSLPALFSARCACRGRPAMIHARDARWKPPPRAGPRRAPRCACASSHPTAWLAVSPRGGASPRRAPSVTLPLSLSDLIFLQAGPYFTQAPPVPVSPYATQSVFVPLEAAPPPPSMVHSPAASPYATGAVYATSAHSYTSPPQRHSFNDPHRHAQADASHRTSMPAPAAPPRRGSLHSQESRASALLISLAMVQISHFTQASPHRFSRRALRLATPQHSRRARPRRLRPIRCLNRRLIQFHRIHIYKQPLRTHWRHGALIRARSRP